MNFSDLLEFVFFFALDVTNVATWIWITVIFIIFITFVGAFWGRAWNKHWTLSRHVGFLVIILVFALFTAYSVFNLRSIARMEAWLQAQQTTLAPSIANSSRFKRAVIVEAYQRLEPNGGQADITPPDQSGDQLRLTNQEDAILLAGVAGEQARSALRLKAPFVYGVPLTTKSPDDIASETIDTLQIAPTSFPRTVSSENEWSATAATLQANYALNQVIAILTPKLKDLRTACWWLLSISIVIPVIFGPIQALKDIKVNPKI